MIMLLAVLPLLPLGSFALENHLARTPPMGWNPYNAFSCDTNDAMYRQQARALVDLGLDKLGYNYFNIDCGWQGTSRNSSGGFTWNPTTIPGGIPALSSYVHDLGLNFGLYSDAGYYSCDFVGGTAHWLGSIGNETIDALTFAEWGADYLKYDNCYAVSPSDFVDYDPPISLEPHYTAMRDALAATERPVVFSICEWGVQDPARWAIPVGNSWRISNDIGPPPSWASLIRIINQLVPITGFARPGAWNDLDLLEVGNIGLTLEEQQTHFAFWAATKSPLMISTDLTKISEASLSILKNERIIALNQDPLGASISFKRRYTNDHDVWAGPLADGSIVALIINWQNSSRSISFDLTDIGLKSANAEDLISGKSLGKLQGSYTTQISAHGALVLKLTSGVSSAKQQFTYYPAASSKNTLTNSAVNSTVNGTLTVVGYIGGPGNGSLAFHNIDGGSKGGIKLLEFEYINADVTMTNTDCSNCRNAYVSVNGDEAVVVQMPLSGQAWDILFSGYLVSLAGFRPGRNNSISISNPSGAYAPDLYRIGVLSPTQKRVKPRSGSVDDEDAQSSLAPSNKF